ncbi:hypothetical protein MTQ10_09135 [Streptomyces sp. XM83C]|uniref:Uncharacterized protein n=1 Tax=Streptomyces thermocoprophilus TaxID=78356 RepID=A0ABV5VCX9_9ACTN|nr:hypothetical protein [Streptomyces sp. XM83C]MCK1819771.1 hypothetical protein [Streptomyces sp. XM83C]
MSAAAHGDDRARAAEFDLVAARAGLPVPAEWRAGAVASYAELMAFAALLRTPDRPPGSEPAAVYRVEAHTEYEEYDAEVREAEEHDPEPPGIEGGGTGGHDRTVREGNGR